MLLHRQQSPGKHYAMTRALIDGEALDIFNRPARIIVSGASDTGKSFLVDKLILKYHLKFKVIIICGVTSHPLQDNPDISSKLVISKDIVDPLNYKSESGDNILIVLDDLYKTVSESELICDLFTRGRHNNVSLIYITQNIFSQGKYSRDISLNASHIILLRVRDISQIKTIARQIFGSGKPTNEFASIYQELVSNKRYGYILLDLAPYGPSQLRVRTNIVGEEAYETAIEL